MIESGFGTYFGGRITKGEEKLIIGKYCSIADGLEIISGEHPMEKVSSYPFHEIFGLNYEPTSGTEDVIIGNDVWIGYNVAIKHGIKIEDGAVIGAKTVVTKNIPPYAIVVGNPCMIIGYRFEKITIIKLLAIKWWEWNIEIIKERIADFMDVNKFVNKYL